MSYSFQVRAATKSEAKQKVADELTKAAACQTCHNRDKDQALAAANAFIDLVDDDDTKDERVNMWWSLCGRWDGTDVVSIESAAVSVTAYLDVRKPEGV